MELKYEHLTKKSVSASGFGLPNILGWNRGAKKLEPSK